ncbi:MAG: J domain-containing protein, partial [Usitatibacter sp.]
VLGVPRNARVADIGRAYDRINADLQKETTAPNPRLAAMAKIAYDTLSDPGKREQYDASLDAPQPKAAAKGPGRPAIVASVAVALVVVAGAGYYFLARTPARAVEAKALSPQEIVQAVRPHLARVEGALMSGEVRSLGNAVATAENEMVTACPGIAAGMLLTVKGLEDGSKAELGRASEDLDICLLTVKGAHAGIKVRSGVPDPREALQAVSLDANGHAQAQPVSVARAIAEAKAPAFELKSAAPLPNGTPIFDSQARLVGIVVAPHSFGEGIVAALGASRIAQARNSPAPS